MTLLAELAAVSARTAETASRHGKVRELAGFLRRLAPAEIETGVAFLTGQARQGKLGLGYASLQQARAGSSGCSCARRTRSGIFSCA